MNIYEFTVVIERDTWSRSRARGPRAQYRTSRSRPARSSPSTRTDASTEPSKTLSIEDAKHPPVPRHVRMSAAAEGPQELAPDEPAQDAVLHRARQGFHVSSLECGGLMEAHPTDVAGDHTIEGQHVVVVVRIERTAEALREGDGSELHVPSPSRRTRTRVTERGP
jgi:hypothetical protein